MPTRNVVLTDSQTDLIDRLIADGRYQNASEALRAGLRLLEREEAEMTALRDRLAAGLEEARSGVLSEGSGEDAIRRAFAAARTASRAPTAKMVCPRTATASADGCASSMVRIGPPWKTVVVAARAWTAPVDIRPLAAAPAINSRRSR